MLKFYEVRKILFEDATFALINLHEMFFCMLVCAQEFTFFNIQRILNHFHSIFVHDVCLCEKMFEILIKKKLQ